MMRTSRWIGIATLFFSMGLAASVFAHQNEQQGPQKKEEQKKERKDQKGKENPQREQHGRTEPQQQRQERQQPRRQQREPQPAQGQQRNAYRPQQRRTPAERRQEQDAWQRDRARNWQREHRTWHQRGGYRGYRIPENHYRMYFGPRHVFRMNTLRVVYIGGHRRFSYGGYWFGLVDPWPQFWPGDWYELDYVYIIYYGGGYYLCNQRYPGIRIAIVFYGG